MIGSNNSNKGGTGSNVGGAVDTGAPKVDISAGVTTGADASVESSDTDSSGGSTGSKTAAAATPAAAPVEPALPKIVNDQARLLAKVKAAQSGNSPSFGKQTSETYNEQMARLAKMQGITPASDLNAAVTGTTEAKSAGGQASVEVPVPQVSTDNELESADSTDTKPVKPNKPVERPVAASQPVEKADESSTEKPSKPSKKKKPRKNKKAENLKKNISEALPGNTFEEYQTKQPTDRPSQVIDTLLGDSQPKQQQQQQQNQQQQAQSASETTAAKLDAERSARINTITMQPLAKKKLEEIRQYGLKHGRKLDTLEDAFEYMLVEYRKDLEKDGLDPEESNRHLLTDIVHGGMTHSQDIRAELTDLQLSELGQIKEKYLNRMASKPLEDIGPKEEDGANVINEAWVKRQDSKASSGIKDVPSEKGSQVRTEEEIYTTTDKKRRHRLESIARIQREYSSGELNVIMSEEQQQAFYNYYYVPFCEKLGLDPLTSWSFMNRMVRRYYGMTLDRNSEMFREKEEEAGLTFDEMTSALVGMFDNADNAGHPFAFTNPNAYLHGTRVFPISHSLTAEEAKIWADYMGIKPSQLEQKGINEWIDKIQPWIDDARGFCTPAQREVIYDFSDAMEEVAFMEVKGSNGATVSDCPYKYSNRINGTHVRLSDYTASPAVKEAMEDVAEADPEVFDRQQRIQDNLRQASRRNSERRKKADKFRKTNAPRRRNDDGTTETINPVSGEIVQRDGIVGMLFRAYVTIDSLTSVFMNVPIAFGSGATRAIGLTDTKAYTLVNTATGHARMTPVMRQVCSDERIKNGFAHATILASTGMDSLSGYLYDNQRLDDRSNFQKINELDASKAKKVVKKVITANGEIMYMQSVGRSIDVANFFDNFFAERARAGFNDDMKQLERQMVEDPVGFLSEALTTPEGRKAFIAVSDSSMGAINPTTVWLNRMREDHPISFMPVWLLAKFPAFAWNAVGKIAPLSHTLTFLANRGYYAAKGAVGGDTSGLQNLIGGEDSLGDGILKNLCLDAAQLMTNAAMFGVSFGVIMALGGVTPPDKDKNIFDWTEWKVMGKPVLEINWMFSDTFMMFGGPLAVSVAASFTDEGKDIWFEMFLDGAGRTLSQCGFLGLGVVNTALDMIDFFSYESNIKEWEASGLDSNNPISRWDYYGTLFTINIAEKLTAPLEWTALNNLLLDNLTGVATGSFAHTPFKIFNPYTDDPDDLISASWEDAMWRMHAQYKRTLSAVLDISANFNPLAVYGQNTDIRTTGYFMTEQPNSFTYDESQMACFKYLSIDENASDEEKMANGQKVFELMGKFGFDAQLMAANGVVIPSTARTNCENYIQSLIDQTSDDFNTMKAEGKFSSYAERDAAWQDMSDKKKLLYGYKDILFDKSIGTFPDKYQNLQSTYHRVSYVEDEAGNQKPISNTRRVLAQISDAILGTDSHVGSETFATGRIPSSISPLLDVYEPDRTDGKGWNYEETPTYYDKDLTNTDLMKDAFGYEGEMPEGHAPTVGRRATKAIKADFDWDRDSNDSEPSKDKAKTETTTSTSGKVSSYKSRGGRSYGSKISIYSHPASSLSTDRPATMYSKNRNYTRYDYLRPDFETKGSRDAYKRSDI